MEYRSCSRSCSAPTPSFRGPIKSKTRKKNRVDALLQEEKALTKRWAEQDLESARETAREILPLLRLEHRLDKDGEQSTPPLLRIMDTIATSGTTTTNSSSSLSSRGGHGAEVVRRAFHILENDAQEETSGKPKTTRGSGSKNNGRVFGLRRSFGLPGGGRESARITPAKDARNGAAGRMAKEKAVEPAPLRSLSVARDGLLNGSGTGVPFERRYRGEGLLERRCGSRSLARTAVSAPSAGGVGAEEMPGQSHDDSQPTPLAQQVLRLGHGVGRPGGGNGSSVSSTKPTAASAMIAVVRVVLEERSTPKCDCDCALPPGADIKGAHDRRREQEQCEVRGVVRVEAYLPSSSKTLTLRVRVQPVTTAATSGTNNAAEAKGTTTADDPMLPLPIKVSTAASVKGGGAAQAADASDQGRRTTKLEEDQLLQLANARHKEECRSRKLQRRALREARDAEAGRTDAPESISPVQDASTGISTCNPSEGRQHQGEPSAAKTAADNNYQAEVFDTLADGGQQSQNHAFSMLLVRANAIVPIRRLHIWSGSWREAIGELVGCPRGQELRTVRVALRLLCSARQYEITLVIAEC